ncbi:MAG: type I-U CRISPR-associated helicase/endonuclease Cas3 [Dehalococcoidia bacterium]
MYSALDLFDQAFLALTSYSPFRWQRRLFEQLYAGNIPHFCNLPTGLGKTSVIPIWLIALALQAKKGATALPRRIIYIVNRRTVVDQATSVVQEMRRRLNEPEHPCWSDYKDVLTMLGQALRSLASTQDPVLAISTLRGELADNEEWKADPSKPAIIIGTIDMVGSKLLFSGYGDGRYWRAQHAGLVGQDSLIVHDEAHLTPAFSDLLHRLVEVQRQAKEPRRIYVMELTVTSRGDTSPALKLQSEDEEDPVTGNVVKNRLDAAKKLYLHTVQVNPGDSSAHVRGRTVDKLVELAMQHRDKKAKVLIYVRSPEDARKVIESLKEKIGEDANNRTALLTGTLRGHERDKLVGKDPVYQYFLDANANPPLQSGWSVLQQARWVSTSTRTIWSATLLRWTP